MENNDLPFKIVAISGETDEVLGLVATLILAKSIYRAAVIIYPGRAIELRQGGEVIEKHAAP